QTPFCINGMCGVQPVCRNGAVLKSVNPGGNEVVCDDPNNQTCEQDMAKLCPAGWLLCTQTQHENRRTNWNFPLVAGQEVVVGESSCRGANGAGGAGHYTIPNSNGQPLNLGTSCPMNCYFGSSRPTCVTQYGCNEQFAMALCCAPTPSCGNGQVDNV